VRIRCPTKGRLAGMLLISRSTSTAQHHAVCTAYEIASSMMHVLIYPRAPGYRCDSAIWLSRAKRRAAYKAEPGGRTQQPCMNPRQVESASMQRSHYGSWQGRAVQGRAGRRAWQATARHETGHSSTRQERQEQARRGTTWHAAAQLAHHSSTAAAHWACLHSQW